MKLTARLAIVLILAVVAQPIAPTTARAQGDTAEAARMIGPPAEQNPYAQKLQSALMAYRVAYNRLYREYYAYPWDQARLFRNYNAAYSAYRTYLEVRRLHTEWQQRQGRFHGEVVTRIKFGNIRPLSARPDEDATNAQSMIMMPTRPVAGALVRVTRDIYYIRPANGVAVADSAMIRPPTDEWMVSAKTDERGHFDVRTLGAGRYRYTVEKEGFQTAYGNFEIGVGSSSSARIILEAHRGLTGRVWAVAPIAFPLIRNIVARKINAGMIGLEQSEEIREALVAGGPSIPGRRPMLIPVRGATVRLEPMYMLARPAAREASADAATADAPATAAPSTDDVASADPAVARHIAPMPLLTATTDNEGRFTFENLEQTSYHMTVNHPGYNHFGATITLDGGKSERDIILIPSSIWDDIRPLASEARSTEADTVNTGANATVDDPFGAE